MSAPARDIEMRRLTDLFDARSADLTPDEDGEMLIDLVDGVLAASPGAARAAQPGGFDASLFSRFAEIGLHEMGLPPSAGGDGATLTELALVADVVGRYLAPVSYVDSVTAARLIASANPISQAAIDDYSNGTGALAFALHDTETHPHQLVPSGACAKWVVYLAGATMRVSRIDQASAEMRVLGSAPISRFSDFVLSDTEILPGGVSDFEHAVKEWRVLTAASLGGLCTAAVRLAVDFATTRRTRGTLIGSLQGVSHALADDRIATDRARNLALKAAWFLAHDPANLRDLDRLAFVSAARAATSVTISTAHIHGGAGVALDSDITLYFERAKSWAVLGGDPDSHLAIVGRNAVQRVNA